MTSSATIMSRGAFMEFAGSAIGIELAVQEDSAELDNLNLDSLARLVLILVIEEAAESVLPASFAPRRVGDLYTAYLELWSSGLVNSDADDS